MSADFKWKELGDAFVAMVEGKDKAGRFQQHTVCGILMHSNDAALSEWSKLLANWLRGRGIVK